MKKFIIFVFFVSIIFSSCEKNDLIIPPEYEMVLGRWESYKFLNYYESSGREYEEYFASDSLPYRISLILEHDYYEVYSDETLLCGDKIKEVQVSVFGGYKFIYLVNKFKKRFLFTYHLGEITLEGLNVGNSNTANSMIVFYFQKVD